MSSETTPQWVSQQRKTFTNWVNRKLRGTGAKVITAIENELDDGTALVRLAHALWPEEQIPPKFAVNPRNLFEKRDNLTFAFNMLEHAGVNCPLTKHSHLLEHDLKMILGLIWSIILAIQSRQIDVGGKAGGVRDGLLAWCRTRLAALQPSVHVENFTTSWSNGIAFLGVLRSHDESLVPDFASRSERTAEGNSKVAAENLELAFDTAEKKLGVPRLLDVEDFAPGVPGDEKSVMTYVFELQSCIAANVEANKKQQATPIQTSQPINEQPVRDTSFEEELKKRIAQLESELAIAKENAKKNAKEAEAHKTQEEIERKRAEDAENKLKQHERELETLNESGRLANEELAKLRTQNANASKSAQEQENSEKLRDAELSALRAQVEVDTKELKQLRDSIRDKEAKSTTLQSTIDNLKAENDSLRNSNADMKKKLSELTSLLENEQQKQQKGLSTTNPKLDWLALELTLLTGTLNKLASEMNLIHSGPIIRSVLGIISDIASLASTAQKGETPNPNEEEVNKRVQELGNAISTMNEVLQSANSAANKLELRLKTDTDAWRNSTEALIERLSEAEKLIQEQNLKLNEQHKQQQHTTPTTTTTIPADFGELLAEKDRVIQSAAEQVATLRSRLDAEVAASQARLSEDIAETAGNEEEVLQMLKELVRDVDSQSGDIANRERQVALERSALLDKMSRIQALRTKLGKGALKTNVQTQTEGNKSHHNNQQKQETQQRNAKLQRSMNATSPSSINRTTTATTTTTTTTPPKSPKQTTSTNTATNEQLSSPRTLQKKKGGEATSMSQRTLQRSPMQLGQGPQQSNVKIYSGLPYNFESFKGRVGDARDPRLKRQYMKFQNEDGSNQINSENILSVLEAFGYTTVTKQQARHLVYLMDPKTSGNISWEKFHDTLNPWMNTHQPEMPPMVTGLHSNPITPRSPIQSVPTTSEQSQAQSQQ